MEQLYAELNHLLGGKLNRTECVSEKVDTALRASYDSQGNPMPLMARSSSVPGKVRRLAWETTMLARSGTVRMPTTYGVMMHKEHPGLDVLLLERMRSVSVEALVRTPECWEQLKDQIVEALLTWCHQDSRGRVDAVDNTQEDFWPSWYRQHVEVLWATLNQFNNIGLAMQDKRILFRTHECLPALFEGFNDNCVLIHGNFCLRSMLKDSRSDQLLVMVGPGPMLWALREYELFQLMDNSPVEDLLRSYLQHAPMAKSFIWRRRLYVLRDGVVRLINTG